MSVDSKPTASSLSVSLQREPQRTAILVRAAHELPSLSALLPALHNMGLQVARQSSQPGDPLACALWLQPESARLVEGVADAGALCDMLRRLFCGEAEDGRLNGLAIAAGCNAHEILLVRAAVSYLRQTGVHMSLRYIAERLRSHPVAVRAWLALFRARFDPAITEGREAEVAVADARLQSALGNIDDADGFDLVARLRELALGIVRTSHYRAEPSGPLPAYVAFKVDGSRLSFLPAPRPYRETFVFSERFEGVHLRGGPVSRGGLRWSDRREDYRTEVLGLVKAQLVKNAVIVPTGAKGGFVCKLPGDEGREVYRLFINGLLDLTDNQTPEGLVVPPPGVVCHDDADPYLVVAADKGTATFSDLANEIAQSRGFWLGDAFASGGSVGYDHKKLGITAKGAWETARIRFSEEGIDADGAGFTAVGIGDMSGDVFGNGTLLMPRMKLLAAFDHRHIFIDPQPDVPRALAQRQRMFALPRSSWADYDRAAISTGGGIWARSERSIALSPQARAVLGIAAAELPPDQLIQAILRAPVDVLYNGGIGTYVKASHESPEAARDRANDRTRIDAPQLRARIVVEGGNLGLTQAARVELASRGVQVYTDAVDNSGGVDCSDHEVNIKIAVGLDAQALQRRSALLAELGDEVERMVLSTNRAQARRLARHARHPQLIGDPVGLLDALAERTGLDRALEGLPDDAALAARPGHALLAPELAVVMAHSKMALKTAWIAGALPELAPWHQVLLQQYFPPRLRGLPLQRHPLAPQIIATGLASQAVDRLGIGAVERFAAAHDCGLATVLDAFAFGFTALRLDEQVLGDAAIAALPADERHACEAAVEQALGDMLGAILSHPELQQPMLWRELRALCTEGAPALQPAEAVAALRERVCTLARLQRALPLLDRGLAVRPALALLAEVERETGLGEVIDGLAAESALDGSALFLRWVRRSFSLIGLRVAAATHGREGEHAVQTALDALGWREPLQRLRVIHQSEWGQRRLEKLLEIAGRLDEQSVLEAVGHDVAA